MGRGPGRPRKSSPRYQPSATAALAARASEQQSKQQKQETSNPDQWVEPPLPPLRPSYQEVDPNNERNVSTALMQPLGKLPTKQQMVKGTTTATTTGRRPGRPPLNKNRATNTPSAPPSRVATPKPVALPKAGTFSTTVGSDEEGDSHASTKTGKGRERLAKVVEAAVQRSVEVGNVELGCAIRKLHEESLNNVDLANLLDVVLAQRATLAETQAFQTYIRQARQSLARQEEEEAARRAERLLLAPSARSKVDASPVPATPTPEEMPSGPKKRGRKRKSLLTEPRGTSEESMASSGTNAYTRGRAAAEVSASRPLDDGDETVSEGESATKKRMERDSSRLPPESEIIQYSDIRDSPQPTSPSGETSKGRGRGRKRARSTSPGRELEYSSEPYAPDSAPEGAANEPPQKKRNTRVKSTNETHVVAGVSHETQAPPKEIGDPSENISENDDYCSACGGMGTVICCDRCPKSFHYTCVNPPLEEVVDLDSWFCNKCQNQINPKPRHAKGLFSDLMDNVDRKNPTSFSLPKKLRDYFEGVSTGKHGEYIDTTDARTGKSRTAEVDHYKLTTKDGKPLLCHKCNSSALGKRQMLYCDYCPLNWHIDCLDPPPANPPPPSRKWQCPAHLDRHFVMRRPRNAKVQDTNLRRGHKNNGIIEIINEEDEEDAGFRDESRGGVIYRLPERGIKLDFLEHVHRKNAEERHRREQSILQSTYNNSRASSVPVAGPGALWSQDDIAAIEVLTSMGFKGQPEQPAEAKVPAFFARIVENADPDLQRSLQEDTVMDGTDEAEQLRKLIRAANKRLEALEKAPATPTSPSSPPKTSVELLSKKEVAVGMPSPRISRVLADATENTTTNA